MMGARGSKVLVLMVVVLLFAAAPVLAHKVNIFAYVEEGTVFTESYFPDGRKVENGKVEVYDSQDKKIISGKTDKEGKFSFPLPAKRKDLTIFLNATMGHKNKYLLKKEDME